MRTPAGEAVPVPGILQALLFLLLVGVTVAGLATPYYLLSLLPGIAILLLLVLGRFPQAGYYLIVFLVPFEAISRLSETYPSLTVSKLAGAWVLVVVTLLILMRKRVPVAMKSPFWGVFLVFFAISLLSAVLSPYPLLAFDNLRLLFIAYSFFALTLLFVTRRGFEKTLPSLMIGGVLGYFVLFLLEYVFNVPFNPGGAPLFVKSELPESTLPAGFSGMLIFVLPLVVHRAFHAGGIPAKLFYASLIGLDLFAVVYLRSRAGLVLFAVVALVLFAENLHVLRPRHLGFSIAAFGALALTAYAFVPASYWERQKTLLGERKADVSISRRTTYLLAGLDSFVRNPLLGTGLGTFREVYAGTEHAATFSRDEAGRRRYAHNTYMEVLVGTGAAGLLAFAAALMMAARTFSQAIRRFRERGETSFLYLTKAYRLSFLSLLVFFFFISQSYGKFFWMILAVSQLALRFSGEGAEEDQPAGETVPPEASLLPGR